MASLQFKHSSYYAVFSVGGGHKRWIKLGNIEKKQARKLLKELELAFVKDILDLNLSKTTTLYQFSERYIDYCKVNKAAATLERERWAIARIKDYFGNVPLKKIPTQGIESFKAKRLSDGLLPSAINKELAILRTMLNKATEWEYSNKVPRIRLLKEPSQPRPFLSIEDVESLFEVATDWLKPMLTVLLNTGVRIGELFSLKWADIDWQAKTLLVKAPKTNSYRLIPINDELHRCLTWLKENYPYPSGSKTTPRQPHQCIRLFCKPDGTRLKTIRGSFKNACHKAGIKNATPYTTRHTFASWLNMSGVDIVSIKNLLGHSNISTTMIYSHITNQHQQTAVSKLPWNNPQSLRVVK